MFRHECHVGRPSNLRFDPECVCGESSLAKLEWQIGSREVNLNEIGSVWRGTQPLQPNLHHFWEYRISKLFLPRSSMIGIGYTKLGNCVKLMDTYSSHSIIIIIGNVSHTSKVFVGPGTLIGFHLDRVRGKIHLYVNREKISEEDSGIVPSVQVVPIIQSSDDRNYVRLISAQSFEDTLAFSSTKALSRLWSSILKAEKVLHENMANKICSLLPPGLVPFVDCHYWFLFGTRLKPSKHKIRRDHEEFDVVDDNDDVIHLATDTLAKRCRSQMESQIDSSSSDSDNAILFRNTKKRRKIRRRRKKA